MKKVMNTNFTMPEENNPLKEIHLRLTAFPVDFRGKVETECSWSTPTYYRKLRSEQPNSSMSNAEREKVLELCEKGLTELLNDVRQMRNRDS